jgi:DNA-directed RNA polymerase specialized sigma24 family protein
VRVLTTPKGSQYTIIELEAIYLRLPPRNPRPVVVSEETVPDVMTVEADAYERLEAEDRARARRRALQIIDDVISGMEAEDRLILQLRFWHGQRVPDIARTLHLDPKKLYKRLDRLFLILRRALEDAGVHQEDIAGLLDGEDDLDGGDD